MLYKPNNIMKIYGQHGVHGATWHPNVYTINLLSETIHTKTQKLVYILRVRVLFCIVL